MKRKCLVSLLIAAMISATFASCGNSSSQAAPAAGTYSEQNDSSRTESTDASKADTADADSKVSTDNADSSMEEPGADSYVSAVTPYAGKADFSEVYAAYLQVLQDNKDMIAAYTWQGATHVDTGLDFETAYPVAFADVYGDIAPELLFVKATGDSDNGKYYLSDLVVCTYEDSKIRTLYDENLDLQVAGGTNYCIFLGKDRSLYRYDNIGDEGWTYNYCCLTEADGGLSVTDKLSHSTYPDENYEKWIDTYYHNDAEVDKEEYEAVRSSYYDNVGMILLDGGDDDEFLIPFAQENGSEALTYDEAVQKLTNLPNGAVPSSGTEDSSDANASYSDVFKELANHSFYYASGVGGWATELKIMEDGVFAGNFHDSNMGETGDGYPNGTVYTCDFMGKFEITDKINDWTYRMKRVELTMENPRGEESIMDGVLYISSEPAGLADGEEFLLYMPGLPTSEMTDDGLMWFKMPRAIGDEEFVETLPCYGIYNVKTGEGFFSGT